MKILTTLLLILTLLCSSCSMFGGLFGGGDDTTNLLEYEFHGWDAVGDTKIDAAATLIGSVCLFVRDKYSDASSELDNGGIYAGLNNEINSKLGDNPTAAERQNAQREVFGGLSQAEQNQIITHRNSFKSAWPEIGRKIAETAIKSKIMSEYLGALGADPIANYAAIGQAKDVIKDLSMAKAMSDELKQINETLAEWDAEIESIKSQR